MTRLAVLALAAVAVLAQDLSGPVVRVIDGDTIEMELAGEIERVRYIGIDTPEMNDRRAAVRELAAEAKAANARLVEGRRVRLELDVEKRDRYGRLLAYVFVGDTMVNEALVRSGHAAPYTFPPNVKYVERFVEAARLARAEEDAEAAPGLEGNGEELPTRGRGERDAGADEETPAEPPGSIPAVAAAAHIGETMTVCGRVASTRYLRRGRRPTFLNLGRPYPDQELTVVIWGNDRDRFDAPPEDAYRGERICVTGEIATYRGTPQIVLEGPEAVQVVR